MIIELTQSYTLVLPLMAGNLLAYALSYTLRSVPVYDALLLQDGINLKRMPTYRGERDWRNLPVSTITTYDPVTVNAQELAAEALGKVEGRNHHAYPVMAGRGGSGEVVGMITHHELAEAAGSNGRKDLPVKDLIGGQRLIQIYPDTSIRDAANILVTQDVLQAPVVSRKGKGRLIGIVTLHDVTRQQNAIEESIERE